jgi:hypothetical protein
MGFFFFSVFVWVAWVLVVDEVMMAAMMNSKIESKKPIGMENGRHFATGSTM